MSDREFRKILLKKFSELQENTNRQLNGISKTMHEQNEKFNKETEDKDTPPLHPQKP